MVATITSIVIVVFVAMGVVLCSGRGSFLIAGYNTMSREEKGKYDTAALCKFMGKGMFCLAFSMVFWVIGDVLNIQWLFIVGLAAFVGIVIFLVIYVTKKIRSSSTRYAVM